MLLWGRWVLLTFAYFTTILRKQFRQNTAMKMNLGHEITCVNRASLSDGSGALMLPPREKGSQGKCSLPSSVAHGPCSLRSNVFLFWGCCSVTTFHRFLVLRILYSVLPHGRSHSNFSWVDFHHSVSLPFFSQSFFFFIHTPLEPLISFPSLYSQCRIKPSIIYSPGK